MGRKLRSTVPTAPNTLTPRWQHVRKYRQQYGKRKTREASHYNRRHRTRDRSTIPPHSEVWIRAGAASQGRIHRQAGMPRSYVVDTSEGTVRRTSRHLQPASLEVDNQTVGQQQPATSDVHNRTVGQQSTETSATVTRSGRVSRPPDRYGQ